MAATQLTAHGAIVGTPDYMSPEQVKGLALDRRSDLFSFGVILAEMIGGRHPFRRPSMGETLSAVLREPPDLGEDIPQDVMALLRRLLAKNPEDRYASAADVRADLARLASSPEALVSARAVSACALRWKRPALGRAGDRVWHWWATWLVKCRTRAPGSPAPRPASFDRLPCFRSTTTRAIPTRTTSPKA